MGMLVTLFHDNGATGITISPYKIRLEMSTSLQQNAHNLTVVSKLKKNVSGVKMNWVGNNIDSADRFV